MASRAAAPIVRASAGQVFNVGGTQSISILALAERVREQSGSSSEIVRVPCEQAYAPGFEDMARRQPDIERVRLLTGWEPTVPLDETLRRACEDARDRSPRD